MHQVTVATEAFTEHSFNSQGVHRTMLATGSGSPRKGAAKWDGLYNLCACRVFRGVISDSI